MKKIISVVLSVLILFTAFPIAVATASTGKKLGDIESENVFYKYKKSTKTLVLSGSGYYTTDYDCLEGGFKFSTQYQLDSYANKVEHIEIGEGITAISGASFAYFKNLKTISLPNTIKKIEAFAFYECYNLESITLPDSLEEIGYEAFRSCRKLKKLNIPKNVRKIEDNFILDTPRLKTLTVDDENPYFCDENNVVYNADKTKLLAVAPKQEKVIIPNSVTKIRDLAFALSSVKEITIPKSVKTLGNGAFYKSDIEKITFKKGVGIKSFGTAYWYYGDDIGEYYGAFESCKNLKRLVVPASVVSIEFRALGGCSSLEYLYIGKGVQVVGPDSFYNCKSLKKIRVNKENKKVFTKNGALYQKVKLKSKKVLELTFVPVSKTSFIINKDTYQIGTFAFANGNIKNIKIPKNVRTIGLGAFYNCKKLRTVKFATGSKLSKINSGKSDVYFVRSCYKKPNLNGYKVFKNCEKLKKIEYPKSFK